MSPELVPAVLAALVNAALFAGVIVAIGGVAMRYLLLPRCGLSVSERAPAARDAATSAAWGAVLVLLAAPARALLQVAALTEPGDAWMPMLRLVLGTTTLGSALTLQGIWGAAALMGFSIARMGRERGWKAAAVSVIVLAMTPGMAGHPAGSPQPTIAMTAATLHVLAAGTWIGGLFHIWRSSRAASDATLLRLLRAFHAVALVAAGTLALTGINHVWMLLVSPSQVLQAAWGRFFAAKLLLVAGALFVGYRHWKTSERAVSAGERSGLRVSLGRELLIALLVIAVTSVLTTVAPPE